MEDKYEEFLEKIKNKESFSFARYGDGEWTAITQSRPENAVNVDGHLFYKDMGEALANVLKSKPSYYLGMQRFAFEETHKDQIQKFIADNMLDDIKWVNADVWHHASIHNEFHKFFEALHDRVVLLVGPEYLTCTDWDGNRLWHRLQIPDKNCWLERDDIFYRLTAWLDAHENAGGESAVVLLCASMPAKWLIDELNNNHWTSHTFLDMGSVFDPYCGRSSRGYHKKILARMK